MKKISIIVGAVLIVVFVGMALWPVKNESPTLLPDVVPSPLAPEVLTIGGDTVGSYGSLRIGMESNPKIGQVVIDGVPEEDVVAKLWLYVQDRSDEDRIMTVYIGQTFTIDTYKITVEDIKGGRGSVRLSIQELKN